MVMAFSSMAGLRRRTCSLSMQVSGTKTGSTGEGQCTYPDGSEYKGHFKYDQFDGYGRYTWPKVNGQANSYEGYWKEGKMDGGGEFIYANGQKLKKRMFKNN